MTDRIPLDHLTSDALDALYEQLEAAEESETQRQLANARDAFASATVRAARAEKELAGLRAVARGYCPACGRGDAAPTVADWEQQRQRADQAEARVVDYEQRLTWHTTCAACARVLASGIRETERANRAEAALGRVRALHCKASDGDTCVYCAHTHRIGYGTGWPCDTIRVLNGDRPAPAATQATHPTGTDPKETT